MYSTEQWPIQGFRERPVPNTLFGKAARNTRLAVTFPGFAYTSQAPLFRYLIQLLNNRGCDVLSVDYDYSKDACFLGAEEPIKEEWFRRDVSAFYAAVTAHEQYERLVLLGKSLGTTALLHLVEAGLAHADVCFVWLTPGTSHARIARAVAELDKPSLLLAGTADEFCRPEDYDLIRANPRATVELFPGADHSLELPGDLAASLENLKRCVDVVRRFLEANGY